MFLYFGRGNCTSYRIILVWNHTCDSIELVLRSGLIVKSHGWFHTRHCTKQISEPQKCIDICANYLFKYFKDLLTQLDAECKYKNSTWFSSTGQIKYFSWKVVNIILYGNFLLGSADNARPLTIAPSHYHFSSFSRPSTLVLWHYCLFKIFFGFFCSAIF